MPLAVAAAGTDSAPLPGALQQILPAAPSSWNRAYEARLAAPIAPILFAVFALLIARWRWWARWAGAMAVCLAYVAYLLYLNDSNLTAIDGLWFGGAAWYPLAVPIVASLIASISLMRSSSAGLSA